MPRPPLVFERHGPEAMGLAAKPGFEALVRSVRLINEHGSAAGPLRPGAGFIQ